MTDASWSEWPAPAKLNLFLHITGRREDGYHTLQTVFQLVDWGDTIRLRTRLDGEIVRVSEIASVPAEADLCVRAARLLQAASGAKLGVDIDVEKCIPMGGGLGGGSSDAATILVALNELWACGLDASALADLGLQLGADVPVFVHGHSAFAEGIGERLQPLQLPERWFLLVDPGVAVPTAGLFDAVELTRDTPATTISRFLAGQPTTNAFQAIVQRRYPAVARALTWLQSSGAPRLSGTGAAVFLDLIDFDQGQALLAVLPRDFRAVVARGVNRSPLLDAVRRWREKS